METVSKSKKRGRPSVFTRTLGDNSFAEVIKAHTETESARSIANALYYQEGLCIAKEICDVSKIFFTAKGRSRRNCILEQLGRIKLQNHYDDESCRRVCELSLKALAAGCTVREIESYIRHGRNCNEW